MSPDRPLSIYIHIPFCLKKCGYCDFHSVAMRAEDVPQRDYALAVCEELRQLLKKHALSGRRVGTIYFGGGTPTIFEPANLDIIIQAIHQNFRVEPDAEVSIEANPETITHSIEGRGQSPSPTLRRIGANFNRISIGIQSFNDRQLKALGRIHDAETAKHAVRLAQDAGFKNIGIDLMWGLPGQTLAELEQDMDTALALGVQHISAYQLTLSSATTLPNEDLAHEMFLFVHNKLTAAGYEHYEISNSAKSHPFRCRHNLNYWRYGEWLGVGSGATSQISTRFTSNKNISDYLALKFQYDVDKISLNAAMAEYSFMNLRTSDGIDLNDFKHRFGREFDEIYPDLRQKWLKNGLIEENRLTLAGWLISDELFRELV